MPHNKLKILIADDEEGLRISMAGILEMEGHEVMTVEDGRAAIELAKKNSFDVAFLDIRMPGVNGVDAFREIKKISPETIVIMMTAYAMSELINEAVNEGAYSCLSKPFDMDIVLNTIKEVSLKPFVMVIDDDQNLCDLLHERFHEHGFNVVTKPSGIEGVHLVQRKVPDVVFLDMVMDDMDGLATLQRMKELLGERCPKVIMMSAYDVGNKFNAARELGVKECLQKPLDIAHMKEMICKVIDEGTKPRICIIDNNGATCDTLKKALNDNGYEVVVARSTDEVLQKLRDNAFSIAVVNMEAAGMTKPETYEKIKKLNPDTGVILISSAPIDEKSFAAVNSNNYSILQKPFDADHVLQMVETIRNSKNNSNKK